MNDICCVGHITLDKVITTTSVVHMAGGTSIYFSNAIHNMDVEYSLVTAVAQKDKGIVVNLRSKGIKVKVLPSRYTVYFENTYGENQDHRTQRVLQKADPFTVENLSQVNARFFHLGPLLADDMPVDLIKTLSLKGKVSLDVQGYLREVRHEKVCPIDWEEKREALKYVYVLKANEHEMEVITGQKNVRKAARILFDWGVREVVITLGSMGSVIYDGLDFYDIPSYAPKKVVDVTGCGDTYMAGYLYRRIKGDAIQDAGEFAAAMATLKIETSGPFTGNHEDVKGVLQNSEKMMFTIE